MVRRKCSSKWIAQLKELRPGAWDPYNDVLNMGFKLKKCSSKWIAQLKERGPGAPKAA